MWIVLEADQQIATSLQPSGDVATIGPTGDHRKEVGRMSYIGATLAWLDRGFDRHSPYALPLLLAGPWILGFATSEFVLPDPWPSLAGWAWAISTVGVALYFLYRNLNDIRKNGESKSKLAGSDEG